ncbi:hypothetical protein HNQ94_000848 [Salirhabdus euzebyi]|uniref:Uncharacterized protein n=1 Tax=Salirhabdus euzebyi TaxID=394506 RepID=A0A841Q1V1_9BACI|nr:hypothetical protein [Salirhabdus euzebyi]MBB6452403.1 hypothetical protein [Salirhabdus euzebyi]
MLKPLKKYWFRPFYFYFQTHYSNPRRLTRVAILATCATLLQATSSLYLSPLATFPILLSFIFGLSNGLISYFITIMLLSLVQISQLIIFSFTTGVIGIGIGIGLYFGKKIYMVTFSTLLLMSGILFVMIFFHFSIYPWFELSFSWGKLGGIILFSLFYCWLWTELSMQVMKRIGLTEKMY